MKTFLMFAFVLVSAVPALAGHRSHYNCETGDDPYGGKQCVYRVPMCSRNSCEAAAKCAVGQFDHEVEWRLSTGVKLINSKQVDVTINEQVRPGKAVRVLESFPCGNKSCSEVRTVVLFINDDGKCQPTALK